MIAVAITCESVGTAGNENEHHMGSTFSLGLDLSYNQGLEIRLLPGLNFRESMFCCQSET